ncbi:ribulokinase [Flavobacteriaceae bacterium TP-CH-4]|uniref:Ribulokinase n=1 Tax=Pelagihabitans pacificus TaxID=2696054 RepID=A0A967ASU1_9FLAO|nr:ribulokinase [Pelagihabitans pacificus]NHF58585.1 ribulokinase [Pelagihabitans pacificus]
MASPENYVIGVDFGTASVRAIVVDAANGEQKASAVTTYERFGQGRYCDAANNQFRQHPLDYLEGLEQSVTEVLNDCDTAVRKNIRAISVDTTGSTPVAVDEKGMPLALHPEFKDNPNAMFFLWKDHTALKEAEEINQHAKKQKTDYLKYVGGIYSSEWFWAKLLHMLRNDAKVRKAAHSWVEHCDWIPFLLTGGSSAKEIKRGVCAAGHKAIWSREWGGFPPDHFFTGLDPLLEGWADRLPSKTFTADECAGNLCAEWAEKWALNTDVKIGIGAMDAHMGAVGGQIAPSYLSKVMGTSTCDMLTMPPEEVGETLIDGICGQVNGSVIPGMIGMEAGQSAFGDVYDWFKQVLAWPLQNYRSSQKGAASQVELLQEIEDGILKGLNTAAAAIQPNTDTELALDWLNGRRTPDADQTLKAAVTDLSLGSDAPRIFRALAEATCFGAKKIVERFQERGVTIKGIIGVGGVAKKSPFIMQLMADVLEMPIRVHRSEQTCAYGAAMFAATVAGIYPRVETAMQHMGQGFEIEYLPNTEMSVLYRERYARYKKLCAFIESDTK